MAEQTAYKWVGVGELGGAKCRGSWYWGKALGEEGLVASWQRPPLPGCPLTGWESPNYGMWVWYGVVRMDSIRTRIW